MVFYGWLITGIDGDADGITLDLDEVIKLDFSDRYFEDCNYSNLEVLVVGVQYGINYGICLCVVGVLGTFFDLYV